MSKLVEAATASAGVLALIMACGSDGSNEGSASGGAAGESVAHGSGGDHSDGGADGVGGPGGSRDSNGGEPAGGTNNSGAGGVVEPASGGVTQSGGAPTAGSGSGGDGTSAGGGNPSGGVGGSEPVASGGAATSGGTGGTQPDGAGGAGATGGAGGDEPVGAGGVAGSCAETGDGMTTLIFTNRCVETVFFDGSNIDPGELEPGERDCRDLGANDEEVPSIRYWGYTGSDPGGGRHTLAELTLNTDWNDFDWYNLSHVDAHNLPMALVPVDHSDCRTLSCPRDLLADCPPEGRWPETGPIASCVSPNRDDPDSPVAQYFEAGCADAYSWSGDDAESMAACSGGEDYEIVFCPPE